MYEFPPGTILVVGALLLALAKGRIRGFLSLLLPVLSFLHLLQFEVGTAVSIGVFSYELTLVRIDRLAREFGFRY